MSSAAAAQAYAEISVDFFKPFEEGAVGAYGNWVLRGNLDTMRLFEGVDIYRYGADK